VLLAQGPETYQPVGGYSEGPHRTVPAKINTAFREHWPKIGPTYLELVPGGVESCAAKPKEPEDQISGNLPIFSKDSQNRAII